MSRLRSMLGNFGGRRRGLRHFVISIPALVASGWSIAGWDFHPLEGAAF